MKNFDQERQAKESNKSRDERTFVIGGEQFVVAQGVHPSVLQNYDDLQASSTASKTVEVIDEFIINMLEGGEETAERWRVVREKRDDPVTLDDLMDLSKWLLATATGNPTGPPDVSSPGPTSTETNSTDDSSSPDAPTEPTTST